MVSKKVLASAILAAASLFQAASAQEFYSPVAHAGALHHGPSMVITPPVTPVEGPRGQYPQLNAPLYPSPVQYTPPWTGGTIVTNQALAPHEMLYPHTYHAMYPPFYYKVKGGWLWTPFGMRQHEHWKLQGTEVTVKYRSHYPLFGGYVPPRVD